MDDELLTWLGNFINFLILMLFTLKTIYELNFDYVQTIITSFGLLISIMIHLLHLTKNGIEKTS